MQEDSTAKKRTLSRSSALTIILTLISVIALIVSVMGMMREWERVRAEENALVERCTAVTTGHKESQETYTKHWFDMDDLHSEIRYKAVFSYIVNERAYYTETDNGIEKGDEEEIHYDPDDPSVCYVGLYPLIGNDNTGYYLGAAITALICAVVFGRVAFKSVRGGNR